MLDLLQVWVLVEVLGIICLPITVTVCHNLPDRGWAFSKTLGLAIFTFCTWFPLMYLHILSYSREFIGSVVLFLLVCSVFGYWRTHREIVKIVRRNIFYIVLTELVFFGMVLLLGWLRSLLPDIYSFEMFMDEGFMAAIMRSPHLPPNDMWYAGYSINYYYYCHYAVATLAKLLGQSPSIAFNTGISMYFGLTAVNLFGVSSNVVAWARHSRKHVQTQPDTELEAASKVYPPLAEGAIFGLLSMVIGLILGNLAATQQWWQHHENAAVGGFDWFTSSRVIDKTINEFPAFSFLLSCFHAHVLALGFAILAAGLAFNLFLEKDGVGLFAFGRGWQIPFTLLATALVIGGLFVMNGWDMPTYLGVAIVCIALQQWRSYERRLSLYLFIDICTAVVPLIFCAFLLFLPFYLKFNSPSQGLGWVLPEERSPLGSEFLIYGLFLFIFVSLLVLCASRQPLFRQKNEEDNKHIFIALASLAILLIIDTILLFLIKNSVTLVWIESITIIGVVLLLYHVRDHALSFTLLLGAVAFFLVAACEVFFLSDAFASNFPRMNTVFKFYFQAWGLLSIAAGSGMYFLWSAFWPRDLLSTLRSKRLFPWDGNMLWIVGLLVSHIPITAFLLATLNPLQFARLIGKMYWLYPSFLLEVSSTTYPILWIVGFLVSLIPVAAFLLKTLNPRQPLQLIGRTYWFYPLLLLLAASTAYPLLAPSSRLQVYSPAPQAQSASLDGLNYLEYYRPLDLGPETHPSCTIDVGGDYYAIRWINSHIQGDPVMVEAVGDVKNGTVGNGFDYTMFSRISTFTGLPTLMGWSGHEVQWRLNWLNDPANYRSFLDRMEAVNTIYTSPNPQQVLATMRQYNAQYLYVGQMECQQYTSYNFPQVGSIDLQRFGAFMQVIYSEHGVTIYKVK